MNKEEKNAMLRQIKMKREQIKRLEEMNREETRWNDRKKRNTLNQKINKEIRKYKNSTEKTLSYILDTTN